MLTQVDREMVLSVDMLEDRAVIRCAGDLAPASAPRLVQAVEEAIDQGARRVDVNCSELTLSGASGIRTLLDVHRVCAARAVPLRLDVTPTARRLLDLVGLWWLGVVSGYEGGSLQETLRRYAELRYRGTFERA